MKKRNFTPNDNQNVIRLLSLSFCQIGKRKEPYPFSDSDFEHYYPDNGVRYFSGKDPF